MMSDSDQIKSDYDHSRDTYYDLIQKGQESLDLMMQFARESEHPRAFEVLSGMIKNVSDVTDRLMDLQKKTKDINKDEKQVNGTTNQNLFVGSTTDLQRMLQEQDKMVDVTPNDSSE
jgi:hypothetical protein|tara:strand:- start:122 stop:472 length:351 start_codon:yes stop_codon:yes gene_type:complete